LRGATFWHYASLAIGFAFIAWLQRDQWFFFDEWAFIKPSGPGLFEPHVGHWSTSPMLIYHALVNTVGLDSYWPYALIVTTIHLSISHLVWRLARRAGASLWVATTGTAVLVFLGAGSENILWAFQIGFLGAMSLGFWALVLAAAPACGPRRFIAIVAIALLSLTWAGTAIPLVVSTAIVLWRRHSAAKAVVFVVLTGGVYVTWWFAFALGSPSNPDTGGLSLHKLAVTMPLFLGVMVVLGLGKLFPVIGVGAATLLTTTAWWLVLARKRALPPALLPASAAASGALVFALLSAFSRADFSVGSGRSGRYVYALVALLLPLMLVALSRAVARWSAGVGVAAAGLVMIALYQAFVLQSDAASQATREQATRRVLYAAIDIYRADPSAVKLAADPDPVWAPDLTMGALVKLYDESLIDVGPYTPADRRAAAAAVEPGSPQ
jgi:hypothetical protein